MGGRDAGAAQVAGLIGDPVEHSLSPSMQNAAFRALGIDARYELWPTPLTRLPDCVAALRKTGVLGANVTVPHKAAVMPHLDELSDTARRIGAVNTIVPEDGRLLGDNTDAYGFARALESATGSAVPANAVVVGAGGAARAVLVSLQEAGVPGIRLVNRTPAKALTLAESLNEAVRAPIRVHPWSELAELAGNTALLVNATSIGWHGDELPFEAAVIERLPANAIVFDLTYRKTAMLRRATARGLRAVDGLPMLIHQGARAFELWTRQPAPVEAMTAAVLAEQARRT